ncbi:MAG: DUF3574 domain-containing protein [Acidobacteria bacterium]|nr:DUF3574 domain-containing protein [Acidobacteriota bacterium]
MRAMRKTALLLFLVFLLSGSLPAQTAGSTPSPAAAKAERYYRTELYFGRSKADGTIVSEEEWRAFLADIVTPRFPEGFTVLHGFGQYREAGGRIILEPSEVLIVLYSSRSKKKSRAKLEEVRAAYIKKFDQESVLRVDMPKRVTVFF